MKGRIWSRIGATVCCRNGRAARSAGASARAPGSESRSAGRVARAKRLPLISAWLVSSRVLGSSCRDSRMLASWFANRCRTAFEESTKAVRSSSRSASSSEISLKLWIERRMLWRRSASPPLILATSRAKGSNWRKALEALRPRPCSGSSASAPLESSSFRKAWVSASSEARISSGLTLGWVEASGIVAPSSMLSPSSLPGSTSITMSLRPVFGRSSRAASSLIRPAWSLSTSIVTSAWPSSSVTPVMSPTLMPAMVTAWPCPGVTAWAEVNSAFTSKRSSPRIGTQEGRALAWLPRMMKVVTTPARTRPMIATKSRRCSRIARLMAPPPGSGDPASRAGPFRSGIGFV